MIQSREATVEDLRGIVVETYRDQLGRDPESDFAIDYYAALGSAERIHAAIAGSSEAIRNRPSYRMSVFSHYASLFDAEATILRHADASCASDPRYLVNFLGVRIEEDYLPGVLSGKAGVLEDIPIPANWHADVAEWAACLRAVELATGTFRVAELGCGWGCWMNNTGVAARRRGLAPQLVGVEGDEGHMAFATRCCAINGFSDAEVTLHRGIAAARGGTALFPRQQVAGTVWGLEPVFDASDEQRREAASAGSHDELRMVPLAEVVGEDGSLDLLHVDIQGGEADLIEGSLDLLCRGVAYLVIGTHSREIEGRLSAALRTAGWLLEIERPAVVRLTESGPFTDIDGVQGWRNLRLRPH